MARAKFLCDAERCIECNACVTACKNENEVPWGINRRRVVTINDGTPGERSISVACLHGRMPGRLLLSDRRWSGSSFEGPLHRVRLLLLCVSFRRAAVPSGGEFRIARQDGQVHLLRRRARGDFLERGILQIRSQPNRRGQIANLRRNVRDQGAIGR